MMKRKIAGMFLAMALTAVSLSGCGQNQATEAANESAKTENEGNGDDKETEEANKAASEGEEDTIDMPMNQIGVLFPTDISDERWQTDRTEIVSLLNEAGYEPETLFAEGNADTQIAQIRELLRNENLKALIISPVDEYALTEVLDEAGELSVPVFDYDKLIMNTDDLKYFVTFDTREIGNEIGKKLIKMEKLEEADDNNASYTIEFLMGEPGNYNDLFLFNGIMEELQPYFDNGTLVCRSEKMTFDEVAVAQADAGKARSHFEKVLDEYYAEEGTPDIICTAYDDFAEMCVELLMENGLAPGMPEWPLITGVGAGSSSVKQVAEGKQSFTVFLDSHELAQACAGLVDTYLDDEDPEVQNYGQYDNGTKLIRTITCDGRIIDGDNYQILVDKGYYREEEIAPDVIITPQLTEPEVTVSPEPSATPQPTVSPEPSETPQPTISPEPSKSPEPSVTDKPEAGKQEAPKATAVPEESDENQKESITPSVTPKGDISDLRTEEGKDAQDA